MRQLKDARREIGELLLELGITPHTEGYAMLRDGTRLIADCDRFRRIGMTAQLYPLLGASYRRRNGTEHAMRDAIRTAWQRDDANRGKEAPSNAALLYMLAARMQFERK